MFFGANAATWASERRSNKRQSISRRTRAGDSFMPEGHGDIRFEQHRGRVESKHNPLRRRILRREGIRSYPKGMTTYASNSTVERLSRSTTPSEDAS